MGTEIRLLKNSDRYRFGEDKEIYLGSFEIRTSILQNLAITEKVNIVHENVIFLIGLDLLDKYKS